MSLLTHSAGKDKSKFRVFDESNPRFEIVKKTYELMHQNQTYEYASEMRTKWCKFNHCKMTVMEALNELNRLVDDSDPDVMIYTVMFILMITLLNST